MRRRLRDVGLAVVLGLALGAGGWLGLRPLLRPAPGGAAASLPMTVAGLLRQLQLVPLDGRPAAPFTLPALDGSRVSLAEARGRVVLLYFWAGW
ncbi:MAG TPA: hypothetical protein VLI67_02335 [Vicinamibacteria bacterium]|nr:hypothetical protein [Vicinamibacteria bacterium]